MDWKQFFIAVTAMFLNCKDMHIRKICTIVLTHLHEKYDVSVIVLQFGWTTLCKIIKFIQVLIIKILILL